MSAYHLARTGASVVVVDRRSGHSGSTPASTALVLYEIDKPLIDLTVRHGIERARRSYAATYAAVSDMMELVGRLGRDCEAIPRRSLYLAARRSDVNRLLREAAARRAIGIEAHFLGPSEVKRRFGLTGMGGIVSQRALEVNPALLTSALLAESMALGAQVHRGATVRSWETRQTGIKLRTEGSVITADWVVVATGYETPEQFDDIARLTRLRSTYAIATSVFQGDPWGERALVWNTADPYLYARTCREGRVLVGGEDIQTADPRIRDRLIGSKSRALLDRLRRLVPGVQARAEYRWAGTFAETPDGLPYIGRHLNWPRTLFTLGFAGNGFTFSLIAAQVIRDIVAGERNELEAAFGLERLR